jgi:hypothetical protein
VKSISSSSDGIGSLSLDEQLIFTIDLLSLMIDLFILRRRGVFRPMDSTVHPLYDPCDRCLFVD